ncbi:putative F-box protein At1g32420 isoform X3 [Quercus robur]|uniref:putative F-box protein At1g32420 isoform X3 n=1 Tax=Quercus robur TaxID=38942 RepID=UPI002162993B|nr:putative F-box protein At1g32420 isoform X3 [Quercus robur]
MSDYLPEEVVREILYRLPAKSLIRFRCVSKSWNSLITSSAFIDSHLTQSLSHPSNSNKLIFRHCDIVAKVEHYKFIHNDSSFDQYQNVEFPLTNCFRLIGSVNGLFCLSQDEQFILWNPCIRKFITLPSPRDYDHVPSRSGFGFDARTNDYKVVTIAHSYTPKETKPRLVEVYSLKEGSWRRIASAAALLSPGITLDLSCRRDAFINGAVHFGVRDWINTPRLKVCPSVLSFDLNDEVFHMTALPKFGAKTDYDIFGFRGSLSVVYIEHVDNKRSCFIWVMKECGVVKSWIKLYTINLTGEFRSVLGFQKNGHIFMEAGLGKNARLSSYDPQSQQLKNLGFYGWLSYSCVDYYVENLVLLDKPVLFDKQNGELSHWVGSRKRKFCAVGLQGVVKKALPLAGGIGRVESKDERVRDKETICKLKKAMVDQQEERVSDKETICKLKKAMVHQQEEIATLKIEMTSLKSQMATLKSLFLSVQQWNNQVENTSSGVGDIGSYLG